MHLLSQSKYTKSQTKMHEVYSIKNVLLYNVCHSDTSFRKRKMGFGVVQVISNNFNILKSSSKIVGLPWSSSDVLREGSSRLWLVNKNWWFYLFLQPNPQRIDFVSFWDWHLRHSLAKAAQYFHYLIKKRKHQLIF